MNTQSLQKNFPEVYQDFFAKCNFVTSAPIQFDWCGSHAWRIGGISIYQKLPIRTYVGIEKIEKENTIEIGDMLVFNPLEQTFIDSTERFSGWDRLPEILQQIIKEDFQGQGDFPGFRLHFLDEMSESHGYSVAAETANLSLLLHLYFGKVSPAEASSMVLIPGEKFFTKDSLLSEKMDGIINIGWKMIVCCGWKSSAGNTVKCAFVKSNYPVISFTEKRQGDIENFDGAGAPLNLEKDPDYVFKMKSWIFRMEKLFNLNPTACFPLDLAFIYPGFGRLFADSTDYTVNYVIPAINDLADFAKKTFGEYLGKEKTDHVPDFFSECNKGKDQFWQRYLQLNSIISLKLLKSIQLLYKQRASQESLAELFKAIKDIARSRGLFSEEHSLNLQHIRHKIVKVAAKTAGGTDVATRFFNYGQLDGGIMVVAPYQKFRRALLEVIEDLQKNYNKDICLDYASWIDGTDCDAIVVEQCLESGLYSKYIQPNSIKLFDWEAGSSHQRVVKKNEDIIKQDFDLFLDLIENKIYIRGESISSKQLPSQKATAELLEFLLNHPGELLTNKQLPETGYSKYRNELQGKIITPLSKLLKEKTKKDLGLKITGKLMNFFVEFNPRNLKIGVIDRI